jgi:hypothetical protein
MGNSCSVSGYMGSLGLSSLSRSNNEVSSQGLTAIARTGKYRSCLHSIDWIVLLIILNWYEKSGILYFMSCFTCNSYTTLNHCFCTL